LFSLQMENHILAQMSARRDSYRVSLNDDCLPLAIDLYGEHARSAVSSELRPLASARFDSQALLCVVFAGNANLMTKELRHTLRDHAAGNYRIFVSMAAELLMTASQREITKSPCSTKSSTCRCSVSVRSGHLDSDFPVG
jgi:hypothetical protein